MCDEENYVYEKHQDNPTNTKTCWRCELFYTGCKARIHTPCNCDESASMCRAGSHTHPTSCAKVEARIAVYSMRGAVRVGCATSTRELITGATQPLQEEARSQLQNINMLSGTVQNFRRSASG